MYNFSPFVQNDYPQIIRIGISSQSPIGKGNQTVFENITLEKEPVKDFRLGI